MSASIPATAIINDIRLELQDAAAQILSQTFAGMDLMRHPVVDTTALEAVFVALMEASCFQDITGQRLDQLEALLTGRIEIRPHGELLSGPAASSTGLDQAATDLLFAGPAG